MARPVEFDRTSARDRALLLFWRRGYQATSLADLLETMEIGRSSFYAAFGDKRTLFLECLDLFAARTLGFLGATLTQDQPLAGLKRFFELGLGRMGEGEPHWGCLLVNTSLEMAGVDEGLSVQASGHLGRVQVAFEASLLKTGCTPQKAADLSTVLMLLLEGLRVSSRRALPTAVQRNQIDTAFRIVDAAL